MASLNLVTGRTGTNHITSQETRAFNRAIYGSGNYRIKDSATSSEYCTISTGSSGGNVTWTISKGSILWNGMHIRITSPVTLTLGTSASGWALYLEYTRNTSTQAETVEVKAYNTTQTTTTNAEFTDAKTSAKVLFYDGSHKFPLKESAIDLVEAEASARQTACSGLQTSINGKASTTDLAKCVKSDGLKTTSTSTGRTALGSVSVPAAPSKTSSTATTLTLTNAVSNFPYIEIRFGGNTANKSLGVFPSYMLMQYSTGEAKSALYDGVRNLHSRYVDANGDIIDEFIGIVCNGTTATIYNTVRFKNGTFSAGSSKTIYFYGIGG